MTRPQIAPEPSDTPDGVQVPGTPVEAGLLLTLQPESPPESRRPKPVVLTVPLHGLPCGVCHCPALSMDTCGSWSRTWHSPRTATTVARYCDVGTPPEGHRGGQT